MALDAEAVGRLAPFDVMVAPRGWPVPLPPPFDVLGPLVLTTAAEVGRTPLVANFVAGLDGTILVSGDEPASTLVALESPHDWLLLALLRTLAPVLLLGAHAPRSSLSLMDGPAALPALADRLGALRASLGLEPPHYVVVSGTGHLPAAHPMWDVGATVVTTPAGAQRLALPTSVRVVVDTAGVAGGVRGDLVAAVAREAAAAHPCAVPPFVYAEAGPRLFAELVAAEQLDELFLTVSPLLAGPAPGRLGLMEGPGYARLTLAGLARVESHLFTRWRPARSGRTTAVLH